MDYVNSALAYLEQYEQVLWFLGVLSVVTIVISVAVIPALLIRLPDDYYTQSYVARKARRGRRRFAPVRMIARNVIGAVLILAGIAMLVLPGQGILTILLGLAVCDLPAKHRLERRMMRNPKVRRAVNWLRTRAGASVFVDDREI